MATYLFHSLHWLSIPIPTLAAFLHNSLHWLPLYCISYNDCLFCSIPYTDLLYSIPYNGCLLTPYSLHVHWIMKHTIPHSSVLLIDNNPKCLFDLTHVPTLAPPSTTLFLHSYPWLPSMNIRIHINVPSTIRVQSTGMKCHHILFKKL